MYVPPQLSTRSDSLVPYLTRFRSAATREARSAQLLARAVSAHAVQRGIAVRAASDVQVLQGQGVTGIVDGEPFWLGSHRYVIERGQDSPEASRQDEALEQGGQTVVEIGNARHPCGLITIPVTVRPRNQKSVLWVKVYV